MAFARATLERACEGESERASKDDSGAAPVRAPPALAAPRRTHRGLAQPLERAPAGADEAPDRVAGNGHVLTPKGAAGKNQRL